MHNLHDKLIKVRDRVHEATKCARRDPEGVQIIAVSKKQPAEKLREVYEAGQRQFGESYLQEALEKQLALADLDIEWHFIGPIQSNKTQSIAQHFNWVHSVDREKIARRLNDQRPSELPPLNVCLQVNIDNEASKSGITPDQLIDLAERIVDLPHLRLRGLMAIPAPREDYQEQLTALMKVRDQFARLQQQLASPHIDTLSMGMSGDLEAAIAAGATMVRVGTDIFGARENPLPAKGN
ncbi:YggS family pyridoxal phosphate-dependent enzyme [Aurantivibrio plasticivorans]